MATNSVLVILALAVLLTFVSLVFNYPPVIRRVGQRIIREESVDRLLLVAKLRLLSLVGFVLSLFLILFFLHLLGSIPSPMEGTIEGTLGANGTLTGKVTINPPFSLGQIYLTFVVLVGIGFAILFVQRVGSLEEKAYEHVYRKLLPQLNSLLCGDNVDIDETIAGSEKGIVFGRDERTIRGILTIMKNKLFPQGE